MKEVTMIRTNSRRMWRSDITVCGFRHTQYFARRKDARNYINKLKKAEQLCRTSQTKKGF